MRSNLMLGAGVGLLVAVVFGATFISQYTNTPDAPKGGTPGDPGVQAAGVPLLFPNVTLDYNPYAESLVNRSFEAFHEVSPTPVAANYWFRNIHAAPVNVTFRHASCSACTAAAVGVVPPDAVKAYLTQTLAGHAFAGANPTPDLRGALAMLGLSQAIEWKSFDFARPDDGIEVPAARSPDEPTWGVYQMRVKVTGLGAKAVSTDIGMVLGKQPIAMQKFIVTLIGMNPFELDPRTIALGDMPENAPPRVVNLTYWSATRTPEQLPPPELRLNIADGFVTVGKPVALSPSERDEFARELASQKRLAPVLAAYRVPVTVTRQKPPGETPREPDIGAFDRLLGVAGPNGSAATVSITGVVTGLVTLVDGTVIDLKDFNGKFGKELDNVGLVSDRPDLKLRLVSDATKPAYVKATLSDAKPRNGRTYWTLKVTVPPEACQDDLPVGSALVLEGESGGQTYRVRLPLKGRGYTRGR